MRTLRLSLLPTATAFGLFAEWAALRRGPFEVAPSSADVRLAVADLVVGVVLVAAGVAAWSRRPQSWTGALLTVSGIAWFLGTFAASGEAGYAEFGAFFLTLHRGPLVHALLTYPSGRPERWSERAAVALVYGLSGVADLGTRPEGAIALALVVVVTGVGRLLRAFGPERRARAAAAVGSAAFAAVLVASGFTRLAGTSGSVDRGVLWTYQLVIAGIAIGLAVDLIVGRWVRATVTGLVVDLGNAAANTVLRDRLASALGDRSLVIAYREPGRDGYVDERGRELTLPRQDGERRVTMVRDGGEIVAALVHDAALVIDPELLESVAAAARIALANVRLQEEVRRQVEELDASRRRVVEAGDAERRRLEQKLREGAERRLEQVEMLVDEARRAADGGLATTLSEAKAKVARTRSDLREFARGIHPRILTERGLTAALGELAARSGLAVELSVSDARFTPPVEAAVYFVCAEALANVGKHAEAAHVAVEVFQRGGTVVVSLTDDGRGGASFDHGSGLRGLADRVEALGGRVTVRSPPGEGTRLFAELPLA